ncbi:calmodulin A [Pelomyxa schiedti]|nr:calmodulin A [Pelomyxa schiedti]
MALYLLSEEQLAELRESFSILDADKDGRISAEDLGVMLRSCGKILPKEKIESYLQDFTTGADCSVDFVEFITILGRACGKNNKKMAKRIFKRFDKDNDGLISAADLTLIVNELREPFTEDDIREMIAEADKDGDGMVSKDEFVAILTGE